VHTSTPGEAAGHASKRARHAQAAEKPSDAARSVRASGDDKAGSATHAASRASADRDSGRGNKDHFRHNTSDSSSTSSFPSSSSSSSSSVSPAPFVSMNSAGFMEMFVGAAGPTAPQTASALTAASSNEAAHPATAAEPAHGLGSRHQVSKESKVLKRRLGNSSNGGAAGGGGSSSSMSNTRPPSVGVGSTLSRPASCPAGSSCTGHACAVHGSVRVEHQPRRADLPDAFLHQPRAREDNSPAPMPAEVRLSQLGSNISTGPLATWADSTMLFAILLGVIFIWNNLVPLMVFCVIYRYLVAGNADMRRLMRRENQLWPGMRVILRTSVILLFLLFAYMDTSLSVQHEAASKTTEPAVFSATWLLRLAGFQNASGHLLIHHFSLGA
jgi:hypothetical protein